MPTARDRRIQKRADAAAALEKHTGPVMKMLGGVIHDLADEVDGLKQFEQDAAYAAELSYRLDNAIVLGDPLLEALDGIIIFFVALGAIGIWRALSRSEKLRGERVDRMTRRLQERGPQMAEKARARLERRIKIMQARS